MSNNEFMNENPSETKILMAETLKRLIKDRPFSKITVQDIVSECNINRNTFYYHFDNNYDLLYFAYEMEIQNIVESFRNANATLPQAMDFVFDYIDKNISLCLCAHESLGEKQLINIFENDLFTFVNATTDYLLKEKNITVSGDFLAFVVHNFTSILCTQIAWYIKYNVDLDRAKFKEYILLIFNVSLNAILEEAGKKKM